MSFPNSHTPAGFSYRSPALSLVWTLQLTPIRQQGVRPHVLPVRLGLTLDQPPPLCLSDNLARGTMKGSLPKGWAKPKAEHGQHHTPLKQHCWLLSWKESHTSLKCFTDFGKAQINWKHLMIPKFVWKMAFRHSDIYFQHLASAKGNKAFSLSFVFIRRIFSFRVGISL